eukprot:Platyproteum_vivax@DN3201_c0_g1_i3.p1
MFGVNQGGLIFGGNQVPEANVPPEEEDEEDEDDSEGYDGSIHSSDYDEGYSNNLFHAQPGRLEIESFAIDLSCKFDSSCVYTKDLKSFRENGPAHCRWDEHSRFTLSHKPKQIEITGLFGDQGWGNLKGEFKLTLMDRTKLTSVSYPIEVVISVIDNKEVETTAYPEERTVNLFGIVPHKAAKLTKTIYATDEILQQFDPNLHTFVLVYKVGGGGGHQLIANNFKMKVKYERWFFIRWIIKLILLIRLGRATLFPKKISDILESSTGETGALVFKTHSEFCRVLTCIDGFDPQIALLVHLLAKWPTTANEPGKFSIGLYVLQEVLQYL